MRNDVVVGWSTLPLIDSKIVALDLDKFGHIGENVKDDGKYVYLIVSRGGKNISIRTPTQFFIAWREMEPIDQRDILNKFKKEIM